MSHCLTKIFNFHKRKEACFLMISDPQGTEDEGVGDNEYMICFYVEHIFLFSK